MTNPKTQKRGRHLGQSAPILVLLLVAAALAGCFQSGSSACDAPDDAKVEYHERAPISFDQNPCTEYVAMGFDGTNWPDLTGESITILDHGAFDYAFGAAKPLFEQLTGATVTNHAADDAGTALQLAAQDIAAGGGTFDILYGVDNVLMGQAIKEGVFAPYTPLQAQRVQQEYRFVPTIDGAWAATPVDTGFIAINVDPRSGITVDSMDDLVTHADEFVTQDPRFSSPGLGFLISTVATYGEGGYLDYWADLLDGGVTITSGWTEAYENRFSGGYLAGETGTTSDKPIVTSYTTSPAYEIFNDPEKQENDVLTAPESTFRQIQTMGILAGSDNRAAAEAWIEFTLTPDFQKLAAEYNAIYPVVAGDAIQASVDDVFAGNDPAPGSFTPADFTTKELGDNAEGWVEAWTDLYTAKRA